MTKKYFIRKTLIAIQFSLVLGLFPAVTKFAYADTPTSVDTQASAQTNTNPSTSGLTAPATTAPILLQQINSAKTFT
jgi:hypothetical protein